MVIYIYYNKNLLRSVFSGGKFKRILKKFYRVKNMTGYVVISTCTYEPIIHLHSFSLEMYHSSALLPTLKCVYQGKKWTNFNGSLLTREENVGHRLLKFWEAISASNLNKWMMVYMLLSESRWLCNC